MKNERIEAYLAVVVETTWKGLCTVGYASLLGCVIILIFA